MNKVVWLYGMPAAGKTTLGKALVEKLGDTWKLVDAEGLRKEIDFPPNFTEAGRCAFHVELRERVKTLRHTHNVVVAAITPYEHLRATTNTELSPNYFPVYLVASLDVRRNRDHKGVYERADSGHFVDFYDHFQEPTGAPFKINTGLQSETSSLALLLGFLIGG